MPRSSSASSSRTTTAAWPAAGASIPARRPSRAAASFRVTAAGPTPPTPPSNRVCPSYFTVLHNDHIGSFAIRKGRYRITLLSVGRISCAQASDAFARFLQDFDGILPRPWFVDPSTGSFMRGSRYVGFRIKPWSGPLPPGGGGGRHPSTGGKCPGTFRVVHNDRIGRLRLPRGPYLITAFGNVSCAQASTQFTSFLANDYTGVLPRPWRLQVTTGTFLRGSGSKNGFRVKPGSRERARRWDRARAPRSMSSPRRSADP